MNVLRIARRVALVAITVLVCSSSLVSFAESYRGLFEWASHHGVPGVWAYTWPIMVDTFIAVGELSLFVALADGWSVRSRLSAWTVTLVGLGISISGNIGQVASHDVASRATGGVAPIAAAASLTVALGTLKRIVSAPSDKANARAERATGTEAEDVPATVPELLGQYVPGAPAGLASARTGALVTAERPQSVPGSKPEDVPAEHSETTQASTPKPTTARAPAMPRKPAQRRSSDRGKTSPEKRAQQLFRADIEAGQLPSLRSIKAGVSVGTDRARLIRQELQARIEQQQQREAA